VWGQSFNPKRGQLLVVVLTTFSATERHGLVLLFTGDIDGMVLGAGEGNLFPRPSSRARGLDVLNSVE